MTTASKTSPRRPLLRTPLPGPRAQALLVRDARCISPSYTRGYPLFIRRGRGVWVEDVDGNEFLDLTAGIAVNATGHCHPEVVGVIHDQAEAFLHMSGTDFYYEAQIELAERLARLVPGNDNKVFFSNSGAEANECALKLARWHTGRQAFISFEGAFHGRTFGALSVSASKTIHKDGFFPMLPGVYHATYGDAGSVERLFERVVPPRAVAAVIVEAIQGEGGYVVPPDDFLPRLRALCSAHGIVLICDEVQAGMGRTGRMFGFEHNGIAPDVVTIAKGIASGLPLGATVARAELMRWPSGAHANTFGGNPLACRAALKTLDLLAGGLMANAESVGAHVKAGLGALAQRQPGRASNVRGRGLMLAFDAADHDTRDAVIDRAFARGLLLLGCGPRGIRLCPALTLTRAEADVALEILADVT